MGLVLALIGVVLLVGVIGYVRAHPKPADEPLTQYVEEAAHAVEQEVEQDAEKVAEETVAVVKKVTKRKSAANTTPTT